MNMLVGVVAVFLYGILDVISVQIDQGNPDAFEGDIGLDPTTRALINGDLSENAFKGVFSDKKWPGAKIPYVFNKWFDKRRRQLMQRAFNEFHKKTCVRFVPRNRERDYIEMVNENSCWSIIGRGGGRQLLKMGDGCLQLGTAVHEAMHAVGFFHEQSRMDRDKYVNILWDNIQEGESYNFNKYRSNYYGQSYDLNSIMHYRNTEFGIRGRRTIEAKGNPRLRLGGERFSARDIKAINAMYCNGYLYDEYPLNPQPAVNGYGEYPRLITCTRDSWCNKGEKLAWCRLDADTYRKYCRKTCTC